MLVSDLVQFFSVLLGGGESKGQMKIVVLFTVPKLLLFIVRILDRY